MKIHEYQAKETLRKFNVPVQDGITIKSLNEFDNAIKQLQQKENYIIQKIAMN